MPGNSVWFGPPRGLYHNEEEYNIVFPANQITKITFKINSEYYRKTPHTNSKIVEEKFKTLDKAYIQIRNTFIIHNARYIYGDGGTVITQDDKIFLPCSPLKNEWYPDKHQSFYILNTPKLIKLDKVILVDTVCSEKNYCHWLRDHLMRFSYLKDLNINYSEFTLVSSFMDTAYQKFTYQKLKEKGFAFKDCLSTQDIKHFEAKEIIILPYLTDAFNADYYGFAKNEWNFVNIIFKENFVKLPEIKRVFLSRRRSNRTSEDENNLIEILVNKYQFREIFLEGFTISEQAHIFKHAEVIVGLHGAGFTNLCFCNDKTVIVEIFSPNFIVSDFWDIATQLGLNYFAYCDDAFYRKWSSYRLAREKPTNFEINKLVKFIVDVLPSK